MSLLFKRAVLIGMLGTEVALVGGLAGCMSAYKESVGGDADADYARVYLVDLNAAWTAALDALKSVPLETANRESGVIQTKWVDNTADRNFTESFGPGDFYLKARYRFTVTLGSGFYNGKPSVKVTINKEQMIQNDVLEGWQHVTSGQGLEERTLLYRIGQIMSVNQRLARLEDDRARREVERAKRGN